MYGGSTTTHDRAHQRTGVFRSLTRTSPNKDGTQGKHKWPNIQWSSQHWIHALANNQFHLHIFTVSSAHLPMVWSSGTTNGNNSLSKLHILWFKKKSGNSFPHRYPKYKSRSHMSLFILETQYRSPLKYSSSLSKFQTLQIIAKALISLFKIYNFGSITMFYILLIHLFFSYSLSTFYQPDAMLGPRNTMSKADVA